MNAVIQQHSSWLEDVSERWQEVLADPSLRDLPYKIETNRIGQLVMSPAKNIHGAIQSAVAQALSRALGGRIITECSVATPEGVKVADVGWCSDAFMARHGYRDPYATAPEICVEIESPSNAESELMAKMRLYLDAGAHEVWLIDQRSALGIFDRTGLVDASRFGIDSSAPALNLPCFP
jgi:Uma2 family endonuclease